jgi:AraC-like DNA-binding protein
MQETPLPSRSAKGPPRSHDASTLEAAARTASSSGDIRVAILAPVPQLLAEHGCEPAPVLASVGLDRRAFDNPEDRVPFATLGRLLERCVAVTGCPHFGLLVGMRFDIAAMGVIGVLMRSAPSVGAALEALVRHTHVNDRGGLPYLLSLGAARAAFGYAIHHQDTPAVAQVYDGALAIGCRMLRALCGPAWKPVEVALSRRAPPGVAPYRRFFGAPVVFDAPHSRILFDARWLGRSIGGADPIEHMSAQRILATVDRRNGRALAERVRHAVQALVVTGDLSVARIAESLPMHDRALRRRLRAEGTSVHRIIDDVRYEVARQLLRETQLPLSEIASALRYSDATAFSRAFRAWAGTTPSRWRAAAHLAPAKPD